MALYETIHIVNVRGEKTTITAGPLHKPLQVHQQGSLLCVATEDIFGFKKEMTCMQQPVGLLDMQALAAPIVPLQLNSGQPPPRTQLPPS